MGYSDTREAFLRLVRLGIGHSEISVIVKEWNSLKALAEQQGLSAIVMDGVESLPEQSRPPKEFLLQWIGEILQTEAQYETQRKAAVEMASLFERNYIRTYVLKGSVVSECYPKPEHRVSSDLDCFLLPMQGDFDAWDLGNDLVKSQGFEVEDIFYKNSTFSLPGLTVENHRFMTPFRGNKTLRNLELMLQSMIRDDKNPEGIDGTCLYRPPVMASSLFLIEHAYSHFLHEGLTWRHVLDWMMFSRKHEKEILWSDFEVLVEEFGFKRFCDSFVKIGRFLLGELVEGDLTKIDKKMLADVWAPLDLHESVRGWKGKLALVGNTWRARWKYHYFADISMLHALWIQAKGVLFEKNPKLN